MDLATRFLGLFISFFFCSYLSAQSILDLSSLPNKSEDRRWWAKDSFSLQDTKLAFSPNSRYKEIDKFPIWLGEVFPSDRSYAEYTLATSFDLSQEMQERNQNLAISFAEIGEAFEIFVNGRLIAKEGLYDGSNVLFHRTVRGVVYPIPKEITKEKDNQLILHIVGDPRYDHTGLYLSRGYMIGEYENLLYQRQDRVSLALILVYLVVGMYHFFLFSKRPKERYNLYFGIFSFGAGVYFFTRSNEIFEFGIDSVISQKLELIVLYLFFSAFFQFISYFYFDKTSRFQKYLFYFHLFIAFVTLFLPLFLCEMILRVWQGVAFAFALPNIIFSLALGVRFRIHYSKNLLLGTILLIISAVYDILDSLVFNSGYAFSKYTFFIYIVGIATVLADKFSEVHRQTEYLNITLERKVKERTLELSKSLESVKELKNQQDGDYFLTSLLLKPLGSNSYKSQNVNVQFLLRQKKKFQFKQWHAEIGGDLCVTNTLVLKGKEYTVFVNADAMGKSIQGAGGVLVLGSVFAAIIERTKMSEEASDIYPERWLKNSFLELQKVFETFDGSMLVSLVLGLVEDNTGNVYYINAEHPSLVLYRDGIALFLDREIQLRKLGIKMPEGRLSVRIFQMQKQDILISGSDGRDDLLVHSPNQEKKVLNEDESKFLTFVEKGRGDLHQIADALVDFGDLTDDLSLMRIEYLKEASPKKSFEELWKQAITSFRKREFKKSYALCESLIENYPNQTESHFLASMNSRRLEQSKDAADMAERVRLRETDNVNVLLKLSFAHIKIGNWERAGNLLHELKGKYPNHKRVLQLTRYLKSIQNKKEKISLG
ncbi:7TM diverse intracellular signaling [Leptospira ryugenii]|uniref:7TM diverse intracellular signaling n=1 Tax=Leptospira ryugenii TaxID=1917863 RepID=A0A2P2DY61_9LEPT|nr:SpoIIE family protein phosphatase [Leptospira ryugenii]GBF49536.1 7TM diverse intracellular signaling [Leptospira ryugenii]